MGYATKIKKLNEQNLIKINIEELKINKTLPFDVYIRDSGINKKIFNKGTIVSNSFLEVLKEKGITFVYVEKSAVDTYKSRALPESVLDSPKAFKNYSFFKENFYQIDRNLLIPGVEVEFSIYNLKDFKFKKLIEASPEKPFMIYEDTIPEEGDILIERRDFPLFREYIEFLSKRVKEKELIIKESAKVLITEILNEPRSGENIKKVGEVVSDIIETIIDEPDSIYSLLSLKGYDYYTYTHCVNVGVLSTGLGIQIGLDRDALFKLGMGAILHDLGKSQIPHEILNKQGKLNDTEYNIIKQHVLFGYELLENQKEFPKDSLTAVLQHHEKLSGRGYPFGLKSEEIKLFGRITAIADCYDALTTRRPYKPPLTPYFALSIIVKEKSDYDPELLKTFIKMLGKIK